MDAPAGGAPADEAPPVVRGVLAAGLGMGYFGAATAVFAVSTSLALSLAALALCGASDAVSVVIRFSLVQTRTPSEMRGRVSSVNSLFVGASNTLGDFEAGLTASWFGVVPAGRCHRI